MLNLNLNLKHTLKDSHAHGKTVQTSIV